MDETKSFLNRLRELSERARRTGLLVATAFLSLPEQDLFLTRFAAKSEGDRGVLKDGTAFLLFGGDTDAERRILFLSDGDAPFDEARKAVSLLRVVPKNARFADRLTNRDYLGALMHLGYRREVFGDIRTDGTEGYVFLLSAVCADVRSNLCRIKRTDVEATETDLSSCPLRKVLVPKRVFYNTNRIDVLLKEAFDLSRRDSQESVAHEKVFLNGRLVKDNSLLVKEGDVVTLRGHGKFLFKGDERETKKGKRTATVLVYR